MTKLLLLILAAKAVPFDVPAFERDLERQAKLHAQLETLPWRPNALQALLPPSCNARTQAQAELIPVGSAGPGTTLRLVFKNGTEAIVDLWVADLAGVPPEEIRDMLDDMKDVVRTLATENGQVPRRTRKLEGVRPVGRAVGFWHQAPEGGAAVGRVLVGGRFVVGVDGRGPKGAEAARLCLKQIRFKPLLKAAAKPGR